MVRRRLTHCLVPLYHQVRKPSHNVSVSSETTEGSNGDTTNGSPGYIYTARTSDLTSINGGGGWSRLGMLKYNDLYKKVKEDGVTNNGAFDSEYMMHWVHPLPSPFQIPVAVHLPRHAPRAG
jgi:hypothetical protein